MALDDDQRKHLDYIQAVISRMSTDSFLVKGWALTVAAAVYGFAASHNSWRVAAVGLLPALLFWGLDAYYLWQERLFRKLYVAAATGTVAAYSMDVCPYRTATTWRATIVSRTVLPIYLILVAGGVVLIVVGATHHTATATPSAPKAVLLQPRSALCSAILRSPSRGQTAPTPSASPRRPTSTWTCGHV